VRVNCACRLASAKKSVLRAAIGVPVGSRGKAASKETLRLTAAAEVHEPQEKPVVGGKLATFFGVRYSHQIVLKLSGLFALDSFAGGFVVQSLAAYWFYLRFGVNPATLGAISFGPICSQEFPRCWRLGWLRA